MTHSENDTNTGRSRLEEAAEDGPLPFTAQQNDAADRGEEDSDTTDPDARAEETGRGDLPGGIAMH